jgi:hypothetical protein
MKALGQGSVASIVKVALTIAWYVQWVLLVCLVVAALSYGGLLALIFNGVVDANILTGGEGRIGDRGGFSVAWESEHGIAWYVVVPALLVGCVVLGGGIVIVGRLRKLFDSFTSAEPFRRENAVHLRVIWITMVVVEVLRYALAALFSVLLHIYGSPEGREVEFDPANSINLTTWMSIAILIVLAEVFREGARLKEEQELTI